jgi:serine/threonine protein kinase
MKEFYTIKSLKHKNLVEYYDSFLKVNEEEEDLYFIMVMEYFNCGDLEKFLNGKKDLERKILLNIFYEIAEGIEMLHKNDIIHRDLKTQNIFVNFNEENKEFIVKIGDFGFSLMNGIQSSNTICGTLMYMVLN